MAKKGNWQIWLVLILISTPLFYACMVRKTDKTIDRSATPQMVDSATITASEIREVKDHGLSSGFGKNALYLRGQLFVKGLDKDHKLIQPCGGCEIVLRTAADTSVKILLTTESDGYFQFNGQNLAYSFFLNNRGLNQLTIEKVDFQAGGVFTMIIVNAAGTNSEKFLVSRDGRIYTWNKVL